jgi:mannose-6-phosphate isomerase-like protein (cupin superfamily)
MTLLTHRGEGPWFPYAGQPMHILAGQDGLPRGFAAMEIIVPAHFAGPIPHAHDTFDEAIYVLSGRLLVVGGDEPQEAAPGSMFVAPRGQRHGFSNPSAEQALVLGIWAPAEAALAFMRDIGVALMPDAPADPDRMREIYARHASRLLPLSRPRRTLHTRHVSALDLSMNLVVPTG